MAVILIVEDEAGVRAVMRETLESRGHEVVEAADGREALELLGVKPEKAPAVKPDLILLDVMMPRMGGFTLNTELKESESTRGVPVLVLTAQGALEEVFLAARNVAGYLMKPFGPEQLVAAVDKALRKT